MGHGTLIRQVIVDLDVMKSLFIEAERVKEDLDKSLALYTSLVTRVEDMMSVTYRTITELAAEQEKQENVASDQPTPLSDEEVQRLLDGLINHPDFASRMGRTLTDNILKNLTEQGRGMIDVLEQLKSFATEVFKDTNKKSPSK